MGKKQKKSKPAKKAKAVKVEVNFDEADAKEIRDAVIDHQSKEWFDGEQAQDIIAVANVFRKEIRRKQKKALLSADAYIISQHPRKNPSRIKLSLQRPLSDSEQLFFRDRLGRGFKGEDGKTETMISEWQPHSGLYRCDFRDFKVRLSANEQVYAESNTLGSVRLCQAVIKLLEDYFLNLHPVAVKTLRELA